jgi:hypothetical protein
MKKAGILTLCSLVAAMLVGFVGTVDARPDYKKVHDAMYKGSAIEGALADAKCNACHFGKKKADRNDYGMAITKAGLTKENYNAKKGDKEAFAKEIAEVLEKVLEEKSQSGETFGDRIKAGKLPGTNPEE